MYNNILILYSIKFQKYKRYINIIKVEVGNYRRK